MLCCNGDPSSHNVEFQIPPNPGLCFDISDTENVSDDIDQHHLKPNTFVTSKTPAVEELDDRESDCNNLDTETKLTDEFYNSTIDDLSNADDPDACIQSYDNDDDKRQNIDEGGLEEILDNKSDKDWKVYKTHN